jgi:hypothetical protein
MRIGYVAQEAPGGEGTPFATVLAAATERARLLAEAEHAKDPHRIGEIHERLNAIDAHGAPARAASILAGLGFDEDARSTPSPPAGACGWRSPRCPDLLLLDDRDMVLQSGNGGTEDDGEGDVSGARATRTSADSPRKRARTARPCASRSPRARRS